MNLTEKKKYQETACIIRQDEMTAGIFSLRLGTENIAAAASPGQFVSVYCHDSSRLLPRPISICDADPQSGELRLVYRTAGKGTAEFASLREGETVRLLGPLGNGFDPEKAAGKKVMLIGGGIGIPPLVYAAKKMCGSASVQAVLGYRTGGSRDALFLADEFAEVMGHEALIATEDGSSGTKGTVLDCIRENKVKADVIFACGPTPMLRALKAYAAENGITCYLSLEERMACGVGACLACMCRSAEEDEHFHVKRKRVCADGPVFNADDIVL